MTIAISLPAVWRIPYGSGKRDGPRASYGKKSPLLAQNPGPWECGSTKPEETSPQVWNAVSAMACKASGFCKQAACFEMANKGSDSMERSISCRVHEPSVDYKVGNRQQRYDERLVEHKSSFWSTQLTRA